MSSRGPICQPYTISDTMPDGMIRDKVKETMAARGWHLLKLSQESGVNYRAIHDWLSDNGAGKRGPSVENVEKILAALGLGVGPLKPSKPRPRRPAR